MYDYLLSEPRINSRYEIFTLSSLFFFFLYFYFFGEGGGQMISEKKNNLVVRSLICSAVEFLSMQQKELLKHTKILWRLTVWTAGMHAHPNTTTSVQLTHKGHLLQYKPALDIFHLAEADRSFALFPTGANEFPVYFSTLSISLLFVITRG